MEDFTVYLSNHYGFYIFMSVLLICAVVGYIVDNYEKKKGIDREAKARENDIKLNDFSTVEQSQAVYQEEAPADLNLNGYNAQVQQPTDGFVSAEQLNNMNYDSATPMTDPNATQYVDPNVAATAYVDPNAVAEATTYVDPAMYAQASAAETTSTPTLQIGIEKK